MGQAKPVIKIIIQLASVMKLRSLIFACTVAAISCQKVEYGQSISKDANLRTGYNVSMAEVESIICSMYSGQSTKSGSESIQILPVVEDRDTVLYIVNYSEGWEIIPADKRLPFSVASSEFGSFDIESMNPTTRKWYEQLIQEVKSLKFADVKCNANTNRDWMLIDSKPVVGTKGGDEHEYDQLKLVYTAIEYEWTENQDHLIPVHWGQGYPWNECVPYLYDGQRAYTGCGAVAIAELEYYWHFAHGIPLETFEYGVCNDTIVSASPNIADFDYISLDLYNLSSSNWSIMPYDSTNTCNSGRMAVSTLMARIGRDVRMCYMPNESISDMICFCPVLASDGINCSFGYYNSNTVLSKLYSNKPSIVRLVRNGGGHFVVVDGYRKRMMKTTYYYKWMPRDVDPPIEPEEPDWNHLDDYVISTPVYSDPYYYFRVNWGWDGANDDGLYMIDSNWSAYHTTHMVTIN